MSSFIRPKEPLRYLKWYDILIITVIMFGQFIVRSTELLLQNMGVLAVEVATSTTTTTDTASSGAAYSSNLTLQVGLLAIAILYLWLRHFDFKSLKIRLNWTILWVPVIIVIVGLLGDLVTTLLGEYNYFSPDVLAYIDLSSILPKFLALSPIAIIYALLNGFYEEFFFLGLLTSVKDKYKWWVLLYSTIIRISFHTYQGIPWALTIGVLFGLIYYFFYKKITKNLLPLFLAHAYFDMFGSTLIYLLVNWGN